LSPNNFSNWLLVDPSAPRCNIAITSTSKKNQSRPIRRCVFEIYTEL
jgi:hypothetical protein